MHPRRPDSLLPLPGRLCSHRPNVRARGAIAYGVGHGVEPWDDDVAFEPGMVVALELQDGSRLRQDVVLIGDGPPEILTS